MLVTVRKFSCQSQITSLLVGGIGWAKALYTYSARNPKEISIQVSINYRNSYSSIFFPKSTGKIWKTCKDSLDPERFQHLLLHELMTTFGLGVKQVICCDGILALKSE